MTGHAKRKIPELLASLGDSGIVSHNIPLSHSICCKLCLSIYKHAKILPCLHSFCLDCLLAYVKKSQNNLKERKLLCPICLEYNPLPGNGIKGLLDNNVIEQSIICNVPRLSLRKKEEPLFPGLYSVDEDTYEVHVKPPKTALNDYNENGDDLSENSKWQNFIQRQKTVEADNSDELRNVKTNSRNISEVLRGLSDEERLERLTNSLKNTFSFSQALQDHDLKLDNDIRALRSPSTSSEYSFSIRDYMQDQLASLQSEAMNIVYRLEGVNTSSDEWERRRARVEQQIHTQADQMVNTIRQVERKALNQIDFYAENNAPLTPVIEGKQKLQTLLRNVLGVIDFIKLILNYGLNREIDQYEQLVADRCHNLLSQVIQAEKTDIKFIPATIIEEEFEKILGLLTFSTTTEKLWKLDNEEEVKIDGPISLESSSTEIQNEIVPENQHMFLPMSFSREFQEASAQMSESGYAQSFTPDSLADDQEHQKLTVDQLIHKFSTEFGLRYNEILPDDSSSNPMTTSITSSGSHVPSPIPEEMNGNSSEPDLITTHSRYRPRSHKRRHSVSDVQQDLAHARIDLSDNRYRGLIQTRKTSLSEPMSRSVGLRPLTNDLEQTKRMLALCKRQLLEAKSMGIYTSKRGESSSHVSSPEHKGHRSSFTTHDPEHKVTRSMSMTHDPEHKVQSSHSIKNDPEHRMQRSASMTHDPGQKGQISTSMTYEHIQRIRTRFGLSDRTRSPSIDPIESQAK